MVLWLSGKARACKARSGRFDSGQGLLSRLPYGVEGSTPRKSGHRPALIKQGSPRKGRFESGGVMPDGQGPEPPHKGLLPGSIPGSGTKRS